MSRLPSLASMAALERAFETNNAARTAGQVLSLARAGHRDVLQSFAGHPFEDDWRDFVYASVDAYFAKARGHIYVVGNPSQPGFLKVGKTSRAPAMRLAELNNEAVVGTFMLVSSWEVYDRHYLEKAAHTALSGYVRFKEFFHAGWEPLCENVKAALVADSATLAAAGILLPR